MFPWPREAFHGWRQGWRGFLSSVAAARAWLANERTVSAMDLPLTPAVVGGTSSTLGAAFNILCTVVGTGLLNLPAGFAQSGWGGAPMLVIMCTMAGYTACVLIKCFKYIGGEGSVTGELQNVLMDDVVGSSGSAETYGDIGQAAFGAFGRWFVVVQMHLTLCMVGTIYHLLAAINLISLVPHLSQPIAVLIVTAVVFGHVLLKTLSEVAAVSYVNITINAVLTVVIITSALTNPPSEAPTTTFAVSDQLSLGKAFASFGFAFGVHPVLPSVYRSMRYPQSYTRMVIAAFTCVMLFYLPMGIIGYATYGEVAPRQLPTAASSRARARRAPRQLSLATKPPSVPPLTSAGCEEPHLRDAGAHEDGRHQGGHRPDHVASDHVVPDRAQPARARARDNARAARPAPAACAAAGLHTWWARWVAATAPPTPEHPVRHWLGSGRARFLQPC